MGFDNHNNNNDSNSSKECSAPSREQEEEIDLFQQNAAVSAGELEAARKKQEEEDREHDMRVKAERNKDEEAIQYMRTLAEELKIQSATTNSGIDNTLFPRINNGKPEDQQANKYQNNLKKIRQFI